MAAINALGVAFTFKETFVPKQKRKLNLAKGLTVFISAFKQKNVMPLMLTLLLAQTGIAIYFCYIALFLVQKYHYSTIGIGHFMTYFGIIMAINYLFIVRLTVKYLSLKNIVFITLLITMLSILIMMIPSILIIWITVIPIAVGNGLFYMAIITLLSNMVDVDSQGWIMGAITATTAIAWSLGGISTGLGSLHSYVPFIIGVGLIALAIVVFSTDHFISKKIEHATNSDQNY
jgi:predicted MFS family arabinose efflux permease